MTSDTNYPELVQTSQIKGTRLPLPQTQLQFRGPQAILTSNQLATDTPSSVIH